jgi:hypothetical protein
MYVSIVVSLSTERLRMFRRAGAMFTMIYRKLIVQSSGIVVMVACIMAAAVFSGCTKNDTEANPVLPPPVTEVKSGTISTDEEWNESGKIYRVTSGCSIEANVTWGEGITVSIDSAVALRIANNGKLTIRDGVTVSLSTGAYIEVGNQTPGTLVATGSASAPVIFKAVSGTHVWGIHSDSKNGGILLYDTANRSRLNFCNISGAISGINVKAGNHSITNCNVSSCKGEGIVFDSTAGPFDSSSFTNISIRDCGGYPLSLFADKLGKLSGEITFSGSVTDNQVIHVAGASVEDSAALWRKRSIPYLFTGTTLISSFNLVSNVTIMPGVVCRFDVGASISMGDPRYGAGNLYAIGTPEDSIYFLNNHQGMYWGDSTGGIIVGMESPMNTKLEYCSVKNATNGIFVNPGVRVTVNHCTITGCINNGVMFSGGAPVDSTAFVGNSIVKNAEYGIRITGDQLVNLSGSGDFRMNTKGGIFVSGIEVWQSGNWKKHNVPYIIDGILDIGSVDSVRITINPGTECTFLSGAYIRVGTSNPGTLIANGTADSPVFFKAAEQGTSWGAGDESVSGGGIRIEQFACVNTQLNSCTVQNATSGIYVDAPAKISNCTVNDNRHYGIIIDKKADQSLITDNSYSGNGDGETHIVTP